MLEPAAKEVFLKYRNALLGIGVDFSDELITDTIEDCNQNLESRLQSVIAYYCWLQTQNKDVVDPNKLFLQAFFEGWNPIGWQDEFLERVTKVKIQQHPNRIVLQKPSTR